MTFLEIVKEIEKGTLPEVIAEKFHFDKLTEYLKNLGNEAILLGCTHFPYIENEIRKRSDMEVINPSQEMLEKIKVEVTKRKDLSEQQSEYQEFITSDILLI